MCGPRRWCELARGVGEGVGAGKIIKFTDIGLSSEFILHSVA